MALKGSQRMRLMTFSFLSRYPLFANIKLVHQATVPLSASMLISRPHLDGVGDGGDPAYALHRILRSELVEQAARVASQGHGSIDHPDGDVRLIHVRTCEQLRLNVTLDVAIRMAFHILPPQTLRPLSSLMAGL